MTKTKRDITTGEWIGVGIAGFLFLWLVLSAFGVFNNYLGWDSRQAGWGWKIITLVCFAIIVIMWLWLTRNPQEKYTGYIVATWVLLAIAITGATGFKGTAGDIKQRVTWMNLDGKVVDKGILYNCYEEYYHFNSNPDLKAYVEKYNELPGVNNYAFNILEGTTPPSTAPRANENFKWHTGAYNLKIPKGCGK